MLVKVNNFYKDKITVRIFLYNLKQYKWSLFFRKIGVLQITDFVY